MKSCRCAQCNVSSARYTWGFALLARDGWVVEGAEPAEPADQESEWLCSYCSNRVGSKQPGLAKPAVASPISTRTRPRSKLRILLVDDEDIVRRCTARALADFDIVSVSSGAEALAVLENDSDFDAVLSDVMMPGMTGPQLYARCYQAHPQLATRFVFASGNPDDARRQLRQAVESVGAEESPILLAKPSSRESLMLALFAAAARTSPRSGTWSIAEAVAAEVIKYRG